MKPNRFEDFNSVLEDFIDGKKNSFDNAVITAMEKSHLMIEQLIKTNGVKGENGELEMGHKEVIIAFMSMVPIFAALGDSLQSSMSQYFKACGLPDDKAEILANEYVDKLGKMEA